MIKWLKTLGLAVALLAIFLIVTFPYSRLGPLLTKEIEKALSQMGISANCSLTGLSYNFPLGLSWDQATCTQNSKPLFAWGEGSLSIMPGRQLLRTDIGKGEMTLQTNMVTSAPSVVKAEFTKVPLNLSMISRLIQGQAMRRSNGFGQGQQVFMILNDLKIDGEVNGTIDFPLTTLHRKSGSIALEIKNLKVPEQGTLSLVGFKEIIFSKAVVKADLKSGKFHLSDVDFTSPDVAFKAEGGFEFQEELPKSVGPLSVKWKVTKTDAILSSPLGAQVLNNCPGIDSQGFCNLRFQRLQELM